MAFLALASQKSLLTLQKNFLQYRETTLLTQINQAENEMLAISEEHSDDDDWDESEDSDYQYYEQLDEQISSQKESVESQITAIENEISGLKTLVNNGIKSTCTLNLSGS